MGIVEEDIARVRDATNLDDLIGSHLQLRRVGRRSVGLCPFHNEKTPSFSVNSELGFYKCFGCGRSGDAITFVREIMHLDFVAAVEYLAGKTGINLRYTSSNENQTRSQIRKLTEIVEAAVDFYHKRLLSAPDAAVARAYLRSRGYNGDDVRDYTLGYAPDDWDSLFRHLKVSQKLFTDAGLGFVNRANRVQDHFRNRLLFPIHNVNSEAVGFGARVLPGCEGPKYKNSFDSKIYSKSRLLYGLHRSKEDIVRVDESIVCEGYTDVIGFDKCGIKRSVATCGTALTEDHIRMLKRFGKRIVLAFDADAAGQAAAERIYEWERSLEVDVAVAKLPEGKDPADLARTDPQLLKDAVEQAIPFLGFRIERVLDAGDLSTPEGNARAAETAIGVVAQHPSELVRDQYLMQISSRCNVAAKSLRQLLAQELRKPKKSRRGNEPNRSNRSTWAGGSAHETDPGVRGYEYHRSSQHPNDGQYGHYGAGGVYQSGQEGKPPKEKALEIAASTIDTVDAKLLVLALNSPEDIPAEISQHHFTNPVIGKIYALLVKSGGTDLHAFIDSLDELSQEVLSQLLVVDMPADEPSRVVAHFLHSAGLAKLERLQQHALHSGDSTVIAQLTELRLLVEAVRSTNFDYEVAQTLLPILVPEVTT